MKTYKVINAVRESVCKESKGAFTTRFAESRWTMDNGLEVHIKCWTFRWMDGTSTKQVRILPWAGYTDKSFTEVQECLWQILNLARKAFDYRSGWDVQIEI